MEDVNYGDAKEDKTVSECVTNNYADFSAKFAANGHDLDEEPPTAIRGLHDPHCDNSAGNRPKKRINPLKIHLGKRPFVDSTPHHNSKAIPHRTSTPINNHKNNYPAVPKLIPKNTQFHNVASHTQKNIIDDEDNKPVPRLVPKRQLPQYHKTSIRKVFLAQEPPKSGTPPSLKFKCRKCSIMTFKALAMLKEHQKVCQGPPTEPASSPEFPLYHDVDTEQVGSTRITRKLYLCSACGIYFENWNLFLHMREKHKRHMCLYCLGMFSKADKLTAHLINKHNVQEHTYDSKEDFCNVYSGTVYLMCCDCEEIYREQDDYYNHDCNKVIPRPVPVLVKSMKVNNVKQKNYDSINGPATAICDLTKLEPDEKPQPRAEASNCVTSSSVHANTENNVTSTPSINDIKPNIPTDIKRSPSPQNDSLASPYNDAHITNGEDEADDLNDSISPVPMDVDPPSDDPPVLIEKPTLPPTDKEKAGGIKLKLNLNNAKSPIIINSTVDPTVGIKNLNKPPSRVRRPPKRYEKHSKNRQNFSLPPQSPTYPPTTPQRPSIKMTICDKADSPFVKTTFYENNQETTLKTLLNNNLENSINSPPQVKTESTVMSTIYDIKLEDNTMNRVPKLTVRVPRELLDKDSSSDYSSDSDASEKLTLNENTDGINDIIKDEKPPVEAEAQPEPVNEVKQEHEESEAVEPTNEEEIKVENDYKPEPEAEPMESEIVDIEKVPEEAPHDELPVIDLTLNRPLDKYPLKELLRLFLESTVYNCIYCNHTRKIAVNCKQLSLHMAAEHRFAATVDSITAEELLPETITAKLKTDAEELCTVYINLDSYDSEEKCDNVQYDNLFECFQCYFKTAVHKELYLHNRKMHQKTILLCVMCKSNFYSYSELLCHLCPGTYDPVCQIKYRCHLCNVDSIPSSFRLMVHLRKIHNSCDVCLEFCHNQSRLSNHVWKHKLHHLCYRCGIAYRNKPDITNHLFWKHGTESVTCKRCLNKKYPHIYHFCSPPAIFVCDECTLQFTKAVYLKVHKRFHTGEFKHACIEEGCTDQFVSKKLLMKHLEEHTRKLASVDLDEKKNVKSGVDVVDSKAEPIAIVDLVNDEEKPADEVGAGTVKAEGESEPTNKKTKKKKLKDKDALMLDVNLPELNLSESDSSDESDSGLPPPAKDPPIDEKPSIESVKPIETTPCADETPITETVEKPPEPTEEKADEQQVLEIWDNFKKFQAKTEKPREKTPPLVPIRKHVCESDHDYCIIPNDLNGDDPFGSEKKKKKKERNPYASSSSSSSSSDSDSSCSCGSNCSCSSSSGSSSSSSSDSDSSDEPNAMKKVKHRVKKLSNRRLSNGSNVDVMGSAETPILIPEKSEPLINETDLETEESGTDEEFYDENPQLLANKMHEEKRNQLMLLASVAPTDSSTVTEATDGVPPANTETPMQENEVVEKVSSSKKKSKKKKKSKSSRKHAPIKINIPKEKLIAHNDYPPPNPLPHQLAPNKITISLQSNTVQIPETPSPAFSGLQPTPAHIGTASSAESKRASKRRRVPNKFYGYSSDDEGTPTPTALKPQCPPKLEWRKEDLPSPVTHKSRKELPSTTLAHKYSNYVEPLRLKAPIPDPQPPRILMNSESLGSSESESSDEGALEIFAPRAYNPPVPPPVPPPVYLNSGTSSLPYAFTRPAGRQAREGESVYCYCRSPYDEVSEMIACDADGCAIEWFHFECVGIMVPPKGKWYCPECRKKPSFAGFR